MLTYKLFYSFLLLSILLHGSAFADFASNPMESNPLGYYNYDDADFNENLFYEAFLQQNAQIASLRRENQVLKREMSQLSSQLSFMANQITALNNKTQYMSTGIADGVAATFFDSTNVLIRNGTGKTGGKPDGLGNLIVGYNENIDNNDRSGSHNIIVGIHNGYSSVGSLVSGYGNKATGLYSVAIGGVSNEAKGNYASIIGGGSNTAAAEGSTVSGGSTNSAAGVYSSVSGGSNNKASGLFASVTGGLLNEATAENSTVSGGNSNSANGSNSAVSGGLNVKVGDQDSWAAGSYHTP